MHKRHCRQNIVIGAEARAQEACEGLPAGGLHTKQDRPSNAAAADNHESLVEMIVEALTKLEREDWLL